MEEQITTTEKKMFALPRKKIIVKPVFFPNGFINDPNHEAAHTFANGSRSYCLKQEGSLLKDPFSIEGEKDLLEKELAVDLNIYKKENNFWKSRDGKVRLTKEGKTLDLSNPRHYIEYLILKTNTNLIAPSGAEMYRKRSYKYALVEESFDLEKKISKTDNKKKAYKLLGKLSESEEKMLNFLKVYGKKVDKNSKKAYLETKLDDIIETDIEGFIKLAEDTTFDMKLLLEEAIECQVLVLSKGEYFLHGGDKLSADEKIKATRDTAIKFLQDPSNQELLMTIKAQINAVKG